MGQNHITKHMELFGASYLETQDQKSHATLLELLLQLMQNLYFMHQLSMS